MRTSLCAFSAARDLRMDNAAARREAIRSNCWVVSKVVEEVVTGPVVAEWTESTWTSRLAVDLLARLISAALRLAAIRSRCGVESGCERGAAPALVAKFACGASGVPMLA